MKYHFKVVREKQGFTAWCDELKDCFTCGDDEHELFRNMAEVLNLYLDTYPENKIIPAPGKKKAGMVEVGVEPHIAFSILLKNARLAHGLSQVETARRLGIENVFSYQRLEKRTPPTFKNLARVKKLFPEISLDAIFNT